MRNVRPAVTTAEAKESLPKKEANFATAVQQIELNSERSACNSESLSSGNRASMRTVSRHIPNKVRLVVGPSNISAASGTWRYSNAATMMSQ